MAYETEKNRLASLITSVVGINRVRDSDLEREATERAVEARNQTGMTYGDGQGEDLISHPSHAERQSRLGVPSTVSVAELATWNYLWNDPVKAAADGLLNSYDHRRVLDNGVYSHWGIGIYTEMPEGQTNEILRRWWFIIWLATQAVGSAALLTPTQTFSKKISFGGPGTHWGYKFGYDGRILQAKSIYLSRASQALAGGRARVPNREGDWLQVANGALAGFWVHEDGFYANANPKIE